ncbi:aminoglycoside phosphotransferase [Sphingomonas sp. DBB INV C78]|uniref:aminoglycoside phosphotransferase family protein n=1 Tax=Sphingomonas sp. DBB INV C78 TaxID=3349434 RepID=UPI0036D22113
MIPPVTAPDFLKQHGWGDAEILPLAGDASFRRYFRVVAPGRSAVLMDAPPDKEDIGPFLAIAAELIARGLSAPQALAIDRENGLLLLEDFGDRLVGPVLRTDPAPERAIYADAIRILASLAGQSAPRDLAPYDEAVMLREVGLFTEWYAPAVRLDVDVAGFGAAWCEVWEDVLGVVADDPVLVLRDYHADNLLLLDRPGLKGLGLLDFQDALAGHPAYDLVSLLQDARRDVSPALEEEMLAEYLAAGVWADPDRFRAHYEILGAQRNTKILGIFTRLWKRDGKSNYLAFQPRVWGYLERNLAHPALGPVKRWFDANVPAIARAEHWERD